MKTIISASVLFVFCLSCRNSDSNWVNEKIAAEFQFQLIDQLNRDSFHVDRGDLGDWEYTAFFSYAENQEQSIIYNLEETGFLPVDSAMAPPVPQFMLPFYEQDRQGAFYKIITAPENNEKGYMLACPQINRIIVYGFKI